jgi:hypothetical protein
MSLSNTNPNDNKDKDFVVLNLNNSAPAKKYFCSHCNTRLVALTQEDMKGGYLCTKCTITYWPKLQPVKKANRFETPGPATDEHGNVLGDIDIPMVAMDNPEASSTTFKQKKLTAAYEALSRHGFKFNTYEER